MIRRQLFFVFVIGCAAALSAEGRLSPVLTADAMVSAAFMAVFQLASFLLVWRLRIAPRWPSQMDAASYLDGNMPWLWWWCAAAVVVSVISPRALWPWITWMFAIAVLLFFTTFWGDVQRIRRVQTRSMPQALFDIAWMRLVTWGAGLLWFFGIAAWYGEVPKIVAWWHS